MTARRGCDNGSFPSILAGVTTYSAHTYVALSGIIPALIAMWLVDRLDAKRPEPMTLRVRVAVFGGALGDPGDHPRARADSATVGAADRPGVHVPGRELPAFVVAGAVEEACKIGMVYWMVWRRPEFDERMDGIVYAARAGLGFALVKNVMYLFSADSLGGQVQLWMMRAVLAVPGHAMWTGMIGALAARQRFDGRGLGLVGGYLLAVAFHGAYDCSVFLQAPLKFEGHFTAAKLMLLRADRAHGARRSSRCAASRARRCSSTTPTRRARRPRTRTRRRSCWRRCRRSPGPRQSRLTGPSVEVTCAST